MKGSSPQRYSLFFNTKNLTQALRYSFPVFLGYVTIGIAFGLLVTDAGYPWWLAPVMSVTMFAGAAQFIAVGLFAAGTSLWEAALIQLVVNARHIAYGLSMMNRLKDAGPVKYYIILCFVMAVVIFFCRIFPFLFFRGKTDNSQEDGVSQDGRGDTMAHNAEEGRSGVFLAFVEKTAPPVAMTVLAFNALPLKSSLREIIPAITAAALTALVHLWKRNTLLSICGGTALYMALIRI